MYPAILACVWAMLAGLYLAMGHPFIAMLDLIVCGLNLCNLHGKLKRLAYD